MQRQLNTWFARQARDLPWRRDRDPYRVWVSEVMLQQTQVATVIPYFQRFVAALPDIAALAAAPEQQVLRLWEGLGYYRRARQLHAAARQLVAQHRGKFPADPLAVRELPGIGRYTAGAILSIAFDAREPILEANTLRLYSRLMAFEGDTKNAAAQAMFWKFAAEILPPTQVGNFNQALMELGATICTPRQPDCAQCPIATLCPTRARGLQATIPAAARKTSYEDAREACVVVWHRCKILLRRCGDGERWAGLWDFPRFPLPPSTPAAQDEQLVAAVHRLTGVEVRLAGRLTTIKHGVTRFRITLDCFQASHRSGRVAGPEIRWIAPAELPGYPLSRTARRIASLLSTHDPRSQRRLV